MTRKQPYFKRKHALTVVQKACREVKGFEALYKTVERKMTLNGYTSSTQNNYRHSIAHLCRSTGKLPQDMADYEIEDYLVKLNQERSLSDSYFKHTIYRLRYVFKMLDLKERALNLPSLRTKKGLPMVLSKDECRRLFCSTDNLKHRVLLCLIYSAGLRMDEARRLKWKDLDRSRHYGLLSCRKKPILRELQRQLGLTPAKPEKLTWQSSCTLRLGYNVDICPNCGKGT